MASKPKALEKIPPTLDSIVLNHLFLSRSGPFKGGEKIHMNRLEEFNGWKLKSIYIALALYLKKNFNCNVLMSRHGLKIILFYDCSSLLSSAFRHPTNGLLGLMEH